MRSPLPESGPARTLVLLVATLVVTCVAGPLGALELSEPRVRRVGESLWVEARMSDLFSPRVEESLSRGMPARVQLRAELWRKRTAWFDKLEASTDGQFRVQFDAWARVYRVQRRGSPIALVGSLDSLRSELSRPIAMQFSPATRLQSGGRYYVAVYATVQPLSVEDVEQLEGWLSGEVDTQRGEGFGAITELPRSMFDAVRNFAGFGDQRARALSVEFDDGIE